MPRVAGLLLCVGLAIHTPLAAAAATLLVHSKSDAGPGTLRQAIADNIGLGGGSTIVFSNTVTGTILLGTELVISNNVTIIGPGADSLVVSGNGVGRVFNLAGTATINISGLTITGGTTSFAGSGGGIFQQSGTLILTGCVVTGNAIDHGNGAGMYAGGTVLASRCTFSVNACYIGGGIYNDGSFTAINCTVAGNSGAIAAGGILSYGTLSLTSCTISGNRCSGGLIPIAGVYSGYITTIRNTIIAGNTGTANPDCMGVFTSQGYNLIGAANGSTGFNGIGDQTGSTNALLNAQLLPLANYGGSTPTMLPAPGSPALDQGTSAGLAIDQRGRPRPADNPNIINATLGDGSDIGAVEVGFGVTTTNDTVAGSLRQSILLANSNESLITFASNVVGTLTLTNGALVISKDLAIVGPGARVLTLSAGTNGHVFEVLSGTVSMSGLTMANGRYVGNSGGFEQNGAEARGGGIFNQTTLTLNSCVLSNNMVIGGQGGPTGSGFAGGGGNGLGGAIANIGTLTLADCYFVGNTASGGLGGAASSGGSDGNGGQGYGGGIYTFGPLTIVRCALAQNNAAGGGGGGGSGSGSGGGLYNDGSITVSTSTIASNSASGSPFDFGGGIYHNGSSLALRGATIAGNQADFGGGLYLGAAADLGDTILANNVAGSAPDCSGTIASSDYNLILNVSGVTITGSTDHNILLQDPQLGPLRDNGGLAPTMAPLASSPVLDKGKNFGPATDQRGAPRPFDFASIPNAGSGDGSDIGAFELGSPQLVLQMAGTAAVLSWPYYYGDFLVQGAATTTSSNAWAAVSGTPSVSGSQYVLTNSPVAGVKFFRLKSE